MDQTAKIFVAGHRGLVGSALCRELRRVGFRTVLTRTHDELDLTDSLATHAFFAAERPRYVFLAAAKVGGIGANTGFPADFLETNLAIQMNVLQAARSAGVQRLLFLGSASIYPRLAPQPTSESALLSGPLEPTNRSYALAKIAGIEQCWASNRQFGTQFLAAMPANLYGPGDRYDLATAHVVPSLLQKAAEAQQAGAQELVLWGTGTPRREFLHSDDLARACIFMQLPDTAFASLLRADAPPLINIGSGEEVTIAELAAIVAEAVGFRGRLIFDPSKPDGVPRRLLDSTRIRELGWRAQIPIREGIQRTWREVAVELGRETGPPSAAATTDGR
jgi:GDP-L-fucose synthase